MDEINFNENYNNKLNCTYYTTIRKKSKNYIIGNVYQVKLKNEPLNKSILVGIRYIDININNINDFYIELDTGMNYDDSNELFEKLGLSESGGYCMLLLLKRVDG